MNSHLHHDTRRDAGSPMGLQHPSTTLSNPVSAFGPDAVCVPCEAPHREGVVFAD